MNKEKNMGILNQLMDAGGGAEEEN